MSNVLHAILGQVIESLQIRSLYRPFTAGKVICNIRECDEIMRPTCDQRNLTFLKLSKILTAMRPEY